MLLSLVAFCAAESSRNAGRYGTAASVEANVDPAAAFAAAKSGDAAALKRALKAGADADARDDSGWTLAQWAANHGHNKLVPVLAAAGADLEATSANGNSDKGTGTSRLHASAQRTPLMRASLNGHVEVVTALLAAGAKAADSKALRSAAAQSWSGEKGSAGGAWEGAAVVRALLRGGASAAAQDKYGSTALHCAARQGTVAPIVKLLLAADEKSMGALLGARNAQVMLVLLVLLLVLLLLVLPLLLVLTLPSCCRGRRRSGWRGAGRGTRRPRGGRRWWRCCSRRRPRRRASRRRGGAAPPRR